MKSEKLLRFANRVLGRTHMPKMLVVDFDGTLAGAPDEDQHVRDWLREESIPFVIATGRSLRSVTAALRERDLPEPEVVISDVGTQIHFRDEQQSPRHFALAEAWQKSHAAFPHAELKRLIAKRLSLEVQEHETPSKLSYCATPEQHQSVRALFQELSIEAEIIFSHQILLDILPPRSSKGYAVSFLASVLDIPLPCVVAVGDSGNDLTMLDAVGMPAAVANHDADLAAWHQAERRTLYVSPRRAGQGVVDAFSHYERSSATAE